MIPGGRLNDRNVKMAMRRMGMSTEELDDVEEVVIRRAKEEIVIEGASVTVVTVQGMKTYQIMGEPKTRARGASAPAAPGAAATAPATPTFPEEDIELVMEQGGVDRPHAIAALKEARGEPAEAILKLMSKKSG